jgi:outer membrane protein OmpU
MKKILLATTMLVAGASIAAAEVTLSGDARMGVISNFSDNNALNGDESDLTFTSRARVAFTLSGESDSGLSFGAGFRADNAGGAAAGDAGSVFVSGAFGKLTLGDVDGAAQMATGHVAGVGLTGLGDLNESTFLAAGDGRSDPTALYEYSAGAFTVYVSATNPVDVLGVAAAPGVAATLTTNTVAMALGAKYTFGDYAVGLGYENVSGFQAAAVGAVPFAADNTDLDHVVVKLSGTIAGFNVQALAGQADGTRAGALVNGEQYAASVSYTTGAITGTVFYTDDSGLGGTTAYGVGGSYDLGGGAKVVGGVAENKDANAGAGATAFDLGLSFSF